MKRSETRKLVADGCRAALLLMLYPDSFTSSSSHGLYGSCFCASGPILKPNAATGTTSLAHAASARASESLPERQQADNGLSCLPLRRHDEANEQ